MFSASFGMLVERSKNLTLQDPEVAKIMGVLSFFAKQKQILEVSF